MLNERNWLKLILKIINPNGIIGLESMKWQIENKPADDANDASERPAPSRGTMWQLMRFPNMRRKFCILTFLWLANSVAYNGLSYNSSNLGVSDTLAFFINAIVEAPAYILTWWAMNKWGRRWTICFTMMPGGLACCCCMFVPEGELTLV